MPRKRRTRGLLTIAWRRSARPSPGLAKQAKRLGRRFDKLRARDAADKRSSGDACAGRRRAGRRKGRGVRRTGRRGRVEGRRGQRRGRVFEAAVADAMRPSTAALAAASIGTTVQRAVDAALSDDASLRWTEAPRAELGGPLSPGSRSDVASLKEDVAAASAMTQQAIGVRVHGGRPAARCERRLWDRGDGQSAWRAANNEARYRELRGSRR